MSQALHVIELAIKQVNQVTDRKQVLDGIDGSLGLDQVIDKRQRMVTQRRQNARLATPLLCRFV